MVTFKYRNHRGEVAERRVDVDAIEYLPAPGYDYPPGWFLSGFDHDKQARRSFALANIIVPEGLKPHSYQLLRFINGDRLT